MAALLNWEVMRPHAKPKNPVQLGIVVPGFHIENSGLSWYIS